MTTIAEAIAIEVYRLPLRQTLDGESALLKPEEEDVQSRHEVDATNSSDVSALDHQMPLVDRDRSGSSRHVVLVTRPSQRDIEQWKERATSTMVQSRKNSTMRLPRTSSAQSNRWILEYKPVVKHSGWLIKRGHSIRNFKRRLFCIIDNELVYHDSHDSTGVRGRLDLSKKSAVQCMLHNGFKLIQGSYQMILYAIDAHDRDVWIRKLQECGVELIPATEMVSKTSEDHAVGDKNPIVFSGWLRKRGQLVKSTKRRWFELTSTTLSYYTHPQGGTKKGSLEIQNAQLSNLDTLKTGERHSFLVRTQGRNLILYADSEEDRSLWIAYLCSAAERSGSPERGSLNPALSSSMIETGRVCTCAASSESSTSISTMADGICRRCMASFISKTEDALLDVQREVQLILASPYSPEGSTSASFIKEQLAKPSTIQNTSIRQFMSGLADYMIHTRINELRMLAGNPTTSEERERDYVVDDPETNDPTSELTERIISIIYEQIEEHVFSPVCRYVHENILVQIRAEAKIMNSKIDVLRGKSQSFFGITPDSLSPSEWSSACSKMHDIDKASLPCTKRDQLVAACKEIYAVYHQEHPSNAPMNADEFIPAFIYVLVHARLENPVALKELMTFFDMGGTQGEAAYFVTCLEIALEYIRSLLIACTVELDATKRLGIEFAKRESGPTTVHHLIPDGQAARTGLVSVGQVLVAVNGVPVHEMELLEITKMVKGIEDNVEFCLLTWEEYVKRFGQSSPSESEGSPSS